MQTLRVNGYDMAYLDVGHGPPLVCVHGTLGDSAPGTPCWGRCRKSIA
jgi:pimeloyl-ACP methyl ester carboxylesterase